MKRDTIDEREPPGPLWKRLAWFVAIWAASVAALGVAAAVIREVILP